MRRSKVRLTDALVRSLKAEGKSVEIRDADLPGFGIRVRPQGSKSFFVRYGSRGEKRFTIGNYPTWTLEKARAHGRKLIASVDDGGDPQSEKRRARQTAQDPLGETFEGLAKLYIERHAKKKKRLRSWMEDERKLRVEVVPVWGSRNPRDIRRREVVALLEQIAETRGGVCANRTQALLSKVFKFGIEREWLDATPVAGVSRLHIEKPRRRVLSGSELAVLWKALADLHPVVASAWRLILLTAQRPGEVLSMQWSQIKEERSGWWWTIPEDVAKNGQAHRVPLNPQALAAIEALRLLNGHGPWVLASRTGDGPLRWLSHSGARLLKITALPHFTPHDLRRTAATVMGDNGIRPDTIDRILNHKLQGVTGVYNRGTYDVVKREAVEVLGNQIEASSSGGSVLRSEGDAG